MSVLAEIQKKLKVAKGNENSFGGYKYRTCSDILEAVKSLLPEGYYITLSDDIVMLGDRYYVKVTASLCSGALIHSVTAFARESFTKKGMDDSQITGAASSYARKYALNGLFAIDDTKDADSMDNSDHVTATKTTPQKTPSNLTIGDAEFKTLNDLLDKTESDKAAFCAHFKIASVSALPMAQFAKASAMLNKKLKEKTP